MRRSLLGKELLVSIEHDMQIELLLQQHEAVVAEALDGTHGSNLAHPACFVLYFVKLTQPFEQSTVVDIRCDHTFDDQHDKRTHTDTQTHTHTHAPTLCGKCCSLARPGAAKLGGTSCHMILL